MLVTIFLLIVGPWFLLKGKESDRVMGLLVTFVGIFGLVFSYFSVRRFFKELREDDERQRKQRLPREPAHCRHCRLFGTEQCFRQETLLNALPCEDFYPIVDLDEP